MTDPGHVSHAAVTGPSSPRDDLRVRLPELGVCALEAQRA